jgi:hypothetical protein
MSQAGERLSYAGRFCCGFLKEVFEESVSIPLFLKQLLNGREAAV